MNPIQPPFTPLSPARRKQLERLEHLQTQVGNQHKLPVPWFSGNNRRYRQERRVKTEVRIPAYEMRTGKDRRKPRTDQPHIHIDA